MNIGTTIVRLPRPSLGNRGAIERPARRMQPLLSVLLIEHRDEVFARLECDLRRLGCRVYRASRAEDVLQIHVNTRIDVTVSNHALPDSSVWLSAAKLRMFDRTARIWLYTARRTIRDRNWAALLGIEKVVPYDGDLLKLSERIAMSLPQSQLRSDSGQSGMEGIGT